MIELPQRGLISPLWQSFDFEPYFSKGIHNMKLYTQESRNQAYNEEQHLDEVELIYSTLSMIDLAEDKLDRDFHNAYTSIDMLSLIESKVTQVQNKLISEPVASKNYLTIYSLNEDFIKAIGKNLGCQKPVVSLEDYRVSLAKEKVHEITMEGIKDILITIWEKIKAFFRSLFDRIILFARRLIGLEPQFHHLEKYISNNIAKIKSRNLTLMDKNQKVQTNIVKYLAPYDVNDFSENALWVIGVPKINAFLVLIEDMIKYSKTNNDAQNIDKFKNAISEAHNKLKPLESVCKTFQSRFVEGKIIKEKLLRYIPNDEIKKINTNLEAINNLISGLIDNLGENINTDEMLTTIFKLYNAEDLNDNPYQEVTSAADIMKNKIKVEDNEIILKFLYRTNTTTYTTPNILNLNIFSMVGNGVPQSDIATYTNKKPEERINYKYSDYGVLKYPSYYDANNMYFAIRDIQGIEKLFTLYKELRDMRVENVYKNIKSIEDKLQSMTKVFDDFISAFSRIVDFYSSISQYSIAITSSEEDIERLEKDTINEKSILMKKIIEQDIGPVLRKSERTLIKGMEYHRRNLTNSTGKVMTELLSIRANFLRDLAYYIYRSTEKYS
jgi:hypothetical protein